MREIYAYLEGTQEWTWTIGVKMLLGTWLIAEVSYWITLMIIGKLNAPALMIGAMWGLM